MKAGETLSSTGPFNHIYCCVDIGHSNPSAHGYEGLAMNQKKCNTNVVMCYYSSEVAIIAGLKAQSALGIFFISIYI